jgi:hypothetical protein
MNKTLLLIICDFLLLNLIHFTAWDTLDKNVDQKAATGGSTKEAIARPGMGDVSRDLEFIAHQYKNTKAKLKNAKIDIGSLRNQMRDDKQKGAEKYAAAIKNANAWVNAQKETQEKYDNLKVATGLLKEDKILALAELDKQQRLGDAAREQVNHLQNENINLKQTTNLLSARIGNLTIDLSRAETDAKAAQQKALAEAKRAEEARIAKAKAEGEAQQALAQAATARQNANKMVATAQATANRRVADAQKNAAEQIETTKKFAAEQVVKANTRVVQADQKTKAAEAETKVARTETKMASTEAKVATEKAATAEQKQAVTEKANEALKQDVKVEEQEKEIAQQGLVQLRKDIAEKIPDQPINANEMAMLFLKNKVQLNIQAQRALANKNMTTPTVLIQVREPNEGDYVHAITHVNDTPYRLLKNAIGFRGSSGSLTAKEGKPRPLHHVRFLDDDPRLIIFPVGPVGSPQVKALGVEPYRLAKIPFKFPKAFIMSKNGRKFGEMDFKIDPQHPGYVKVDRIFFNFGGKFNPAQGDLVFSQTGDLLGIMVNNHYCRVLQNTTPANAILFGPANPSQVAKILLSMRKKIEAKPFALH